VAAFSLSPREKRLLRRMAKGMADSAIAQSMGGNLEQVRTQRERLLRKLKVRSQADLVAMAQRLAPWRRGEPPDRVIK
jgi:DNA-binding CsgD family transcriptional regulator